MNQVSTPLSAQLCSKLWRDDSFFLECWELKACIGNAQSKMPYKDLLGICDPLYHECQVNASDIWMTAEMCMTQKPLDSPILQPQLYDISLLAYVCHSRIGPNYFYFCFCVFLWGDGGLGYTQFINIQRANGTSSPSCDNQLCLWRLTNVSWRRNNPSLATIILRLRNDHK